MTYSFKEKFGLAVLLTAWLLFIANALGNVLIDIPEPVKSAGKAKPAAEMAAKEEGGEAAAEQTASAGGDALTMLADADADKGRKLFKKCVACHTPDEGGKNKVGPNLWDIVGGAKAAREGFKYSKALAGLGGEWSYADLDAFLRKPKEFAKGTKMAFAGFKKPGDRAAVIVYLRGLSGAPKPLP